jgi:putative endonuclease
MLIVRSTVRALDRLAALLGKSPQRAPHLQAGSRGEDEAYFHLRKLGYTIVARDYRSPHRRGDIDLIGWDDDILCFIEVKTRSRRNFMAAEAAIDDEKRATLSSLAQQYLHELAHARAKPDAFRFDVVSVYLATEGTSDITLFKNAFPLS